MSKVKKKKCRIHLNDNVNQKLDALEDHSALEVFEARNSAQDDFLEMVSKAVEEEQLIDKNGRKRKVKSSSGNSVGSIFIILVLCFLFVLFIIGLSKLVF